MDKVKVSCGCGRVMAMDAVRGRGAFRCGCGARIRIVEAPMPARTGCIGTTASGGPCRFPIAHADIAPMCDEHHEELMTQAVVVAKRELSSPDYRDEERILRERALIIAGCTCNSDLSVEETQRRLGVYRRLRDADLVSGIDRDWIENPRMSVVYFVRNGDQVKIGTTVNVPARMRALTLDPRNVLGTEPGSQRREAELHRRFAKYRIRSEWFHAAPEILDYASSLSAAS
jgi:hypothetical protein